MPLFLIGLHGNLWYYDFFAWFCVGWYTGQNGITLKVTDGHRTIDATLPPDEDGKFILQLPEGARLLPDGTIFAPDLVNQHFAQELANQQQEQPETSQGNGQYYEQTVHIDHQPETETQAVASQPEYPTEEYVAQTSTAPQVYAGEDEGGEQVMYVNPRQYDRIIKRREMRCRLEKAGRIPPIGAKRQEYLHESRHRHALNRTRSDGGRFYQLSGETNRKRNNEKKTNVTNTENPAQPGYVTMDAAEYTQQSYFLTPNQEPQPVRTTFVHQNVVYKGKTKLPIPMRTQPDNGQLSTT
ncbi:unnamed protein product, partial [Mesorhabditis spiculigera]